MTKVSKHIIELFEGEIITKPNKNFSETDRIFIIEEYLNTNSTKAEIWKKYIGQR